MQCLGYEFSEHSTFESQIITDHGKTLKWHTKSKGNNCTMLFLYIDLTLIMYNIY